MIELLPFDYEHMKLALADRAGLETAIGARVPSEWPLNDYKQALPFFIDLFGKTPSEPTGQFVIVDRGENSVVGDIGFSGKPNELGFVEIGYAVLLEWRNRGIAKEAIRLLIVLTKSNPLIKGLEAETAADNLFSQKALVATGFTEVHRLRWRLLF